MSIRRYLDINNFCNFHGKDFRINFLESPDFVLDRNVFVESLKKFYSFFKGNKTNNLTNDVLLIIIIDVQIIKRISVHRYAAWIAASSKSPWKLSADDAWQKWLAMPLKNEPKSIKDTITVADIYPRQAQMGENSEKIWTGPLPTHTRKSHVQGPCLLLWFVMQPSQSPTYWFSALSSRRRDCSTSGYGTRVRYLPGK